MNRNHRKIELPEEVNARFIAFAEFSEHRLRLLLQIDAFRKDAERSNRSLQVRAKRYARARLPRNAKERRAQWALIRYLLLLDLRSHDLYRRWRVINFPLRDSHGRITGQLQDDFYRPALLAVSHEGEELDLLRLKLIHDPARFLVIDCRAPWALLEDLLPRMLIKDDDVNRRQVTLSSTTPGRDFLREDPVIVRNLANGPGRPPWSAIFAKAYPAEALRADCDPRTGRLKKKLVGGQVTPEMTRAREFRQIVLDEMPERWNRLKQILGPFKR